MSAPLSAAFCPLVAARLQWPAGVVEPQVATLEQHAGHGDVVVLDERDPVAHSRARAANWTSLADHLLAEVVGRVGLAGKYAAAPAARVEQQGSQPFGLGQQQGGPFVGGEAPGKTDGQHGGVERLVGPGGVDRGDTLLEQGRLQTGADETDQRLLALAPAPATARRRAPLKYGPNRPARPPPRTG